jgi:6-carboxyhexanoate--CoA ligase
MDDLYSVRMRAAVGGDHRLGGQHISGAERLIPGWEINTVLASLVERAHNHERGQADFVNIAIEKVDASRVQSLQALPVATITADTYVEGRFCARTLLGHIGIADKIADRAIGLLTDPEHQMRGAVLLDIYTGARLEQDPARGIRATHLDIDYKYRAEFADRLSAAGLHNEHIREALTVATKVCHAPGIIAELCWSDDPGYSAGYVASKKYGYVRFPHLKPIGLARGGRIFFFDPRQGEVAAVVTYLEKQPVLIQPPKRIDLPASLEVFCMKYGG